MLILSLQTSPNKSVQKIIIILFYQISYILSFFNKGLASLGASDEDVMKLGLFLDDISLDECLIDHLSLSLFVIPSSHLLLVFGRVWALQAKWRPQVNLSSTCH